MNITTVIDEMSKVLSAVLLKVLGALILWFVGRWLITVGLRLIRKGLRNQALDATLTKYILSIVDVTLNIVLIVALLGFFGVETTSFAALLAAAGVAIGAAWAGLLSNFAAGVFLVLFRPFQVGDFISAGGITGTVRELGLFVTTIDTPDNVRTIIGNTKIFSDNIQNFSTNPYRRVELVAQLDHTVAPADAISRLKAQLSQIPNVISEPAPDVEILEFTLSGPVLAVRPYCNNEHYWQVYFDTNRVIRDTFGEAGYPTPEQHFAVRNQAIA